MSVSGAWIPHYSWGCASSYEQDVITADTGATVDGKAGSGASSAFDGASGCWYLTEQGCRPAASSAADYLVSGGQVRDGQRGGSRCADDHGGVMHGEAAPAESMAAPPPASSSRSLAGGDWLWPPEVGTNSSHSSRV